MHLAITLNQGLAGEGGCGAVAAAGASAVWGTAAARPSEGCRQLTVLMARADGAPAAHAAATPAPRTCLLRSPWTHWDVLHVSPAAPLLGCLAGVRTSHAASCWVHGPLLSASTERRLETRVPTGFVIIMIGA